MQVSSEEVINVNTEVFDSIFVWDGGFDIGTWCCYFYLEIFVTRSVSGPYLVEWFSEKYCFAFGWA